MATNICTDVSGLRLILVLTRAFAMRNAVQKKIKNLEETQLQKLDSTRVESSTVCMTLTQLPGPPLPFPPVPSSFEFTTHSRAQRSPGEPHVLRRNMYMYIFPQLGLRGQ